ncbi:hypothetical protein A3C20_02610 [Candidatus Kaiserbacteria bacterium RIFCSPHIGHO2_02_FULL_55_25]|uniref:CARDB domain-containing protein n=1 Tax=Candidatus Kaiserbacteria bacterium RIFCSPHIGHO2_02_FULL_55_25 TaxID=1798498 RepID=A0A1F6E8Z4_9BACT|nr:MAG: hypothetical protein A2764_03170 [Candidatus Kaiserbacteria bacterium RIFCSPHIGHO2_01_FULL_55_79]OGG70040.1 MAG: hypothetical protein A3C20_02610 [Candidatus Kaiserbacteria bacterium RIFCSPHIGHO2_02_FULL_55_25]OGG82883.1 MAG: hypothetical protein A3A42_00975 [Candidatus Kaiserbacteria bacterium RIFCSPLOWO2_01_FULL_55_25]
MADAQHPPQASASPARTEPISVFANVLAVAGIIILVIIVLWGIIHIFSLSGGWFSSLFSGSRNTAIQVTVPSQADSGEPVAVNWKYSPSVKGNYALLYPCTAGLSFSLYGGAQIPCGGAYTLGLATSSATIFPLSTATTSVRVPLTILYIPSSTSTTASVPAQGSASTVINPAKLIVTPVAEPRKPATPINTSPVATGPADLAVTILSLNADSWGNATVTFDIGNVGGSPSGTYYFSAQLPTTQSYSYSSPAQAPLAAGSRIVNTLNFTMASPGTFTVSVTSGNDSNASNNYVSQYLNSPYNVQYQNQYYTPSTYQTNIGNQQCYWNGAAYICNQGNYYNSGNGLPYYQNSGQYPYITPNGY